MPSADYMIRYLCEWANAVSGIDKMIGKLKELDVWIDKTQKGMKAIGASTPNMSAFNAQLGKMTATATSSATAATTLAVRLNGIKVAAAGATGATSGLGSNLKNISSSLGTGASNANALTGSLSKMMVAAIALRAGKAVIGEFGGAIKEAREAAEGRGEIALGARTQLVELKNMLGVSEDAVMNLALLHSTKTGSTVADSAKFLTKLHSGIEPGRVKGNVKAADLAAIASDSAIVGSMYGVGADTSADVSASIINNEDLGGHRDAKGNLLSPQQFHKTRLDTLLKTLSAEGRGKTELLARNLVTHASENLASGRVEDIGEAAAQISSASFTKNAGRTANHAKQALAMVNRTEDKPKAWLQAAGINDAVGEDKFVKLDEALDKAEAEFRQAGGVGKFDRAKFLQTQGFHESTQVAAAVVSAEDSSRVVKSIAAAKTRMGDPALVESDMAKHRDTKEFAGRASKAEFAAAEIGAGAEQEDLTIARRSAMARLLKRNALDATNVKIQNAIKGGFGLAEFVGLPSAEQNMIDEEVSADLTKRSHAAGLKTPDDEPLPMFSISVTKTLADKNRTMGDNLRKAGRNPHGDSGAVPAGIKAGINAGGGAVAPPAGAAGAVGPQASLDASRFDEAVSKFAQIIDRAGGGGGGGGRRVADLGPPPDMRPSGSGVVRTGSNMG